MKNEPSWEEMNDFEQWFYGSGAYADGDLQKDVSGEYIMPLTQAFKSCWDRAVFLAKWYP